ncbi:hypothetical protein MXMO3_01718 [Maritalea myrionectae]|uniref:Arc-like DNA binding domain-containing protein n=1 Tax=Maritalea myrionectae TaxID=454601 RepID=A0A2R4ME97_9HYPH|nr:Arc family DNA-binding protein [Maritalea myrionectae]AVX04244.1 hypothetical protein MXMO3_01718 [Maritalea myrionectae]
MKKNPVAEWDKFMLRMPPGMRDKLKKVANENSNSLNSEIIARLEQSFNLHPTEKSFDAAFTRMEKATIEMEERSKELEKYILKFKALEEGRNPE